MRRICKCPLNSLKPLQQLSRRSETVCPSFRAARNIIVLAGGDLLPPPHAALGACLRCCCTAFSHSHFQLFSVNVLLRHPHAGFGAYRRAAQKTRRKKGIQCHRSVNGAPPSSCRLWSRGAAVSRRCNALDRKAFARRPRAAFRAFCPPERADRRNELP